MSTFFVTSNRCRHVTSDAEDIFHEDVSRILDLKLEIDLKRKSSILTLKTCELALLEVLNLMQHILAVLCSYLSKLIPVFIKVDVTVLSLRKIQRSN
jgi:hypothetical protein